MAINLSENNSFDNNITVPEDGVDRRTAQSLRPAFQALANRTRNLLNRVLGLENLNINARLAALEGKIIDYEYTLISPVTIPANFQMGISPVEAVTGAAVGDVVVPQHIDVGLILVGRVYDPNLVEISAINPRDDTSLVMPAGTYKARIIK
jgi:hypothetical protein